MAFATDAALLAPSFSRGAEDDDLLSDVAASVFAAVVVIVSNNTARESPSQPQTI